MTTTLSQQRITSLRDWLQQKLASMESNFDLFLEDGDDRIIWVGQGDEVEVVVITLQPGAIVVEQ